MSTPVIYGIKNCNTMKKAMGWLDDSNVTYEFHDYKKQKPSEGFLKEAIKQHGWETIINRRGMTWRNLSDDVKNGMNEQSAIEQALHNPSLIKRPLLQKGRDIYVGFDEDQYQKIFG